MKFIVENWFVIVAIAAVGGSIGYAIFSSEGSACHAANAI